MITCCQVTTNHHTSKIILSFFRKVFVSATSLLFVVLTPSFFLLLSRSPRFFFFALTFILFFLWPCSSSHFCPGLFDSLERPMTFSNIHIKFFFLPPSLVFSIPHCNLSFWYFNFFFFNFRNYLICSQWRSSTFLHHSHSNFFSNPFLRSIHLVISSVLFINRPNKANCLGSDSCLRCSFRSLFRESLF